MRARSRDDRDNQFGILVRQLRTAAGLTQTQLASRIGTTVFTVCRWECRRNYPGGRWMPAIARALKVKASRLGWLPRPAGPRIAIVRATGPETLGTRFRRVRFAAGLTMDGLGVRLGLGADTIRRLGRARRDETDVGWLISVARRLGCRPVDLIPGTRFEPRFGKSAAAGGTAGTVESFGLLLRRERRRRGMSARDIARRARLTEETLTHLESGLTRWPKLSTLLKIARGLGCPVSVLLPPR